MSDIKEFTDLELTTEFARRRKAAEKEAAAARKSYGDNITSNITRQAINALVPLHSRASCSDKDISNGWGSADGGGPRCTRCALLEVERDGWWDPGFIVEVSIWQA